MVDELEHDPRAINNFSLTRQTMENLSSRIHWNYPVNALT
jgi:hypothetical protein